MQNTWTLVTPKGMKTTIRANSWLKLQQVDNDEDELYERKNEEKDKKTKYIPKTKLGQFCISIK